MSYLYITESGSKLGINGGSFVITYADGHTDEIPKETIEGITLIGTAQMSTDVIKHCLTSDVRTGFMSRTGDYYGTLISEKANNGSLLIRQVQQFQDESYSLALSKRIIYAKIANQSVVARRYAKSKGISDRVELLRIYTAKNKVWTARTVEQLMGIEGQASKALSKTLPIEFRFETRSRRPAKDPFNAMLNLCYSILYKEIIGNLEVRGLNAYIGFMHKTRTNHAALASDLMEEWHAPIVDMTVMSLIQGNEICAAEFILEDGACTISKECIRTIISKLEGRLHTESKYLSYIEKAVTFREAIRHQCESLMKSVNENNPEVYDPIIIR